MNLSDLADAFKGARITARLTQREAAEAAGVSTLLVSKLERGELSEIGSVKLLALLRKVGLEVYVRPAGQQRTLNDIADELDAVNQPAPIARAAKRVRHSRAKQ